MQPKGGLGIHWNFVYWPRGSVQVCIFAGEGGLYLSLYFYHHMSQENPSKNAPCFHMSEEKENMQIHVCYI